jgi:peptidoglycan-associated lipoprotein
MKHESSALLAIVATGLMSITVVGCGGETPPPKTAATAPAAQTTVSSGDKRKSDQDVNLSSDVRQVCNIDDSEKSPKFDFDSSSLSSADREVLQQVAKCLTDGALKGKNVQLVGRADARGETEYNMGLGGSRATAAKQYLTGLGIDAKRLSETSRGELDATGTDEEGYRKDRRVDIRVAK